MGRGFLIATVAATAVAMLSLPEAFSPGAAALAAKKASLKETLQTGLFARQPKDVAFIAKVVGHVESGKLPRRVVLSMYRWSIRRNSRRPYPHFQEAMKRSARKLGITL